MNLRTRGVTHASRGALLAAAVALAPVRPAHAESAGPNGPWSTGDLTETFTVQQWSAPCGPAPVSSTMMPGGPVTVRTEGGELVIEGGARTLRTDRCLDPLQTIVPQAHSGDGHQWRTRCSTPQSDPRRATVNAAYFLSATDDTLTIAETGRYEFLIEGARCVADVRRDATAHRVVAPTPLATAAPAPAPLPAQAAVNPCATPGDPVRLEVRPSRKLLRLGDTFSFRAVVLDGNGCATPTPIQWSIAGLHFKDGLAHPEQPVIDAGKLTVPSAPAADATFDVVATAAGRGARASVQTTSPAGYEALLAQSGLGPSGEEGDPAVVILATGTLGASDAHAEDGARRRRTWFIAVVGGLALALGAVGLVARRRARRALDLEQAAVARHSSKMRDFEQQKRQREEQHAEQMRAHLQSVALAQQMTAAAAKRGVAAVRTFCPSCRREFTGGGGFCPHDANRLVAVDGHENLLTGPPGGVCPTCKRGFNPGVKVCPHDGEELVPAVVAAAVAPPPTRGKICPTCGDRFDGAAGFCGKDGTQLVLLN